jgi:hypothetical protein
MAVLWLLAFLPAVLGASLVDHPVVGDSQTVLDGTWTLKAPSIPIQTTGEVGDVKLSLSISRVEEHMTAFLPFSNKFDVLLVGSWRLADGFTTQWFDWRSSLRTQLQEPLDLDRPCLDIQHHLLQ